MIFVLTGCFGPGTMHYDIQQYNKEVLSSEKEMLLYNIAALAEGQSPHFTMVSNISASRSFTATSTFTFTNVWNKFFLATKSSNFQKGSNTYAEAVATGVTEMPTITYLPIQGQDFASRFESPITPDKLNIFLEDINLNPDNDEHQKWLMLLIAQDVEILHGDWKTELSNYVYVKKDGKWELKPGTEPNKPKPGIVPSSKDYVCPEGPLTKENGDDLFSTPEGPVNKENDYDLFSKCVSHIIDLSSDVSEIEPTM
jgi:hypothetical protein